MSERQIISGALLAEEAGAPLKSPFISEDSSIRLYPEIVSLLLHVDEPENVSKRDHLNKASIESALNDVAHYLILREPYLHVEYIMGATHEKMARIAVQRFGFTELSNIAPSQFDDEVLYILQDQYDSDPHLVIMPSEDFVSRFKTTDTPSELATGWAGLSMLADRQDGVISPEGTLSSPAFMQSVDLAADEKPLSKSAREALEAANYYVQRIRDIDTSNTPNTLNTHL